MQATSGAVVLLRELASVRPGPAQAYLESVWELLRIPSSKEADRLHVIVLEQVSYLCASLWPCKPVWPLSYRQRIKVLSQYLLCPDIGFLTILAY